MRVRPAGVAALAVSALTVGILAPASADDVEERKRAVDASVHRLRADLAETSRELGAAALRLQSARSQLPAAQSALAAARGKLAAARARNARLAQRLAAARAAEAAALEELQRIVGEMAQSEAVLAHMARRAYQAGTVSELAVVLDAETVEDLATRLLLVRSVLRSENTVLGQLAADRADVAAQGATLEARREEIAQLKEDAEAHVAEMAGLEEQAEGARARVDALVAQAARARATVAAEQVAEEARLAEREAESDRLSAVLVERARAAKERARREAERAAAERAAERAAAERRSAGRSGGGSPEGSSRGDTAEPETGSPDRLSDGGDLTRPINASINSPYGMRFHPIRKEWRLHDGADFAAGCGTPIDAAGSGEVIWAEYKGGYGYQLAIDHGIIRGSHLVTSYSHMPAGGFAAGPGERVSRGERIGAVGTSGMSTGCHLHFMVYVDGTPVDPAGWI